MATSPTREITDTPVELVQPLLGKPEMLGARPATSTPCSICGYTGDGTYHKFFDDDERWWCDKCLLARPSPFKPAEK